MRFRSLAAIVCTLFFSVALCVPVAHANTLNDVEIAVVIHSDGSATFTEKRHLDATSGTEHYIPYQNLGESEITDFSVSEKGVVFENVSPWNTKASLEEKAGKSGVNPIDGGVELCFGIGSLGEHEFVLSYRVSNFVRTLSSGEQAFYWQFIHPDSTYTENITLSITSDIGYDFSDERTQMWAYGFDGESVISREALAVFTVGEFTADNYVVVLGILPTGVTQTSASYPYSAQEIHELADHGAIWDSAELQAGDETLGSKIQHFFSENRDGTEKVVFFAMITAIVVGLGSEAAGIIGGIWTALKKRLDPARRAKPILPKSFKATIGKDAYWRTLPQHLSPLEVCALVEHESTDLISALFLTWIRDGRLIPGKYEAGKIIRIELDSFRLVGDASGMQPLEASMWGIVHGAAGENGVLEFRELEKYIGKHTSAYRTWLASSREESIKLLESRGYVMQVDKRKLFFTQRYYELTDTGQSLVNQIEGFKNYLLDFSIINERSVADVVLWNQFLIWAAFLGIAQKVEKQFNLVDPQFTQTSTLNTTALKAASLYSISAQSGYDAATRSSSSGSSGRSGRGGSTSSRGGRRASGSSRGGGIR